MCPFCFATTPGFVVAGTVSTSGLAALAFTAFRKKQQRALRQPHDNFSDDLSIPANAVRHTFEVHSGAHHGTTFRASER